MNSTIPRLLRRVTRLDFVDGLGVALGKRSVALVLLQKRFASISVQAHRVVPLPPPEEAAERRRALAAAVRDFRGEFEVSTDRVFVSVPRSMAVLARLSLPAAAKTDLDQVVEFESDRVLPTGRDDLYLDYVSRDAGDKVEILLIGIPRRTAAEILDALEEGGAYARSIVPTPLALQDLIGFSPAAPVPSMVLVVDDAGEVEIEPDLEGEVSESHVLRGAEASSEVRVRAALSREIERLPGVNGEIPTVGICLDPAGESELLPAESLSRSRELLAGVKPSLGASDDFFEKAPTALLPALGAALAAVREGSTDVNLLPPEERRGVDEGAPVLTFLLAAVLVATSLLWVSSALVKDYLILRGLRAELAALEPQMRQIHAAESESDQLREKLLLLTEGAEAPNSLVLQELTKIVPNNAYLTSFRVRNGRVELEGFATAASDLVPVLEKSRLLRNAQFTSPVTKVQDNQERFSLTTDVVR